MKWSEYQQEMDAIHAPDALTARLRAMQPASADAAPAAAFSADKPHTAAKKRRSAPIPWKRITALAACFAFGVIACDAFGWRVLPRMGSSSSAGVYTAGAYAADPYEMEAASTTVTAPTGVMEDSAADAGPSATVDNMAGGVQASAEAEKARAAADRKIIRNASLTMETQDYETACAALQQAAADAGGYEQDVEENSYTGASRSCSYTFRIPANAYESFLAGSAEIGSITNRTENASDITADYVDVQARIEALTTQRDRLLAMEQQADSLSDLLAIQDQLTDVQYQLESWQGQQKYYDDQVDYCTVAVYLQEVETYTPTQTGLWQRIGNAFTGGMQNFGAALAGLLLGIIRLWPWLVVLGIGGGIAMFFRKKHSGGGK